MKLIRWLVVLASTATVAACSDGVAPTPDKGQFTGRWAGSDWVGDANAVINTMPGVGPTLYILGHRFVPDLGDEQISVHVPFTGPGKYLVAPGDAELQVLVGGDVITGRYTNTGEAPGVLEITSYVDGVIEGELSFDARSNRAMSPYGPYGERAKLEGGRFRATILVAQ